MILDNLASHKGKVVRRAIRRAGARLWFLFPYSPDLNSIEQAFAKIEHWMRDARKRTVDDAWWQLGALLAAIEPQECRKYIRNAGYGFIYDGCAVGPGPAPGTPPEAAFRTRSPRS